MRDPEQVILIDECDRAIGVEEKLRAHEQALRHRALSVFLFRKSESGLMLLLQRRHPGKYHSGGLWTNTCCSHPRPREKVLEAGRRRLREEMGIDVGLERAGVFGYVADVGNGLTENEIVHVLVGVADGAPVRPDPREVSEARVVRVDSLREDVGANSERYTAWLSQGLRVACGWDIQPSAASGRA